MKGSSSSGESRRSHHHHHHRNKAAEPKPATSSKELETKKVSNATGCSTSSDSDDKDSILQEVVEEVIELTLIEEALQVHRALKLGYVDHLLPGVSPEFQAALQRYFDVKLEGPTQASKVSKRCLTEICTHCGNVDVPAHNFAQHLAKCLGVESRRRRCMRTPRYVDPTSDDEAGQEDVSIAATVASTASGLMDGSHDSSGGLGLTRSSSATAMHTRSHHQRSTQKLSTATSNGSSSRQLETITTTAGGGTESGSSSTTGPETVQSSTSSSTSSHNTVTMPLIQLSEDCGSSHTEASNLSGCTTGDADTAPESICSFDENRDDGVGATEAWITTSASFGRRGGGGSGNFVARCTTPPPHPRPSPGRNGRCPEH